MSISLEELSQKQRDEVADQIIAKGKSGNKLNHSELRVLMDLQDFDRILPVTLKLKGKPMNVIDRRPMFRHLFKKNRVARKSVSICARQLGKTASLAAAMLMNMWFRDNFSVLYVAPQAIFCQKLHASYHADMIASNMLPWVVQRKSDINNVNSKSFATDSKFLAASMFANPNNVLGSTCDWAIFDETQSLDYDLIPYALETLGTGDFRWEDYMGTARGIEGTLQAVYEKSSMATWHVPCSYCPHEVNFGDYEECLKTIQPTGICCPKCSTVERPRLLMVERGTWRSKWPDREGSFMGYHIPQIIVRDRIAPMDRSTDPKGSAFSRYVDTIYDRVYGATTVYSPARIKEEILGISSDQGGRPLTPEQLRAASCLSIEECTGSMGNPPDLADYTHVSGGADWGGGEITSFTVGTVIARHHSGEFHVLGAVKPLGLAVEVQPLPLAAMMKRVGQQKLSSIGADGLFVGPLQNRTLAEQAGVPCGSVLYSTQKRFCTDSGGRFNIFSVDKSTLLFCVYTLIITGKLKFPKGSWFERYSQDLMAVIVEEIDTPNGQIRRYARIPSKADDYLHALAYGLLILCLMAGIDLPELVGLAPGSSVNRMSVDQIGSETPR